MRAIRSMYARLRLQWRLTLTYVLVSVVAALALEVALIVLAGALGTRNLAPEAILGYIEPRTAEVAPYVTAAPPNREALHEWLHNGKTGDARQSVDVTYSATIDFAHVPRPTIVVTDTAGRVLACTPRGAFAADAVLTEHLPLPHAGAVAAALRGGPASERALRAEPGVTAVAAPIRDASGALVGVLYARVHTVTNPAREVIIAAGELLPVAVAMLIAAALAGLLFGHLAARRITRRIQPIMAAAAAWRQGDFRARAGEASGDEIGQLARDLDRMAEELQTLFRLRQDLAMLDERNRLARDLHDTVKQQVFAAVMQIGAAQALLARDPEAAGQRLAEAKRLAHQAQFDLGAILRELRSALPQGEGLAVALRGYAADWARQTGITAEVGGALDLRLSPVVEEALFRIAQEALANIARHSGATRAQIDLTAEAGRVSLRVSDNGEGFDSALAPAGMGLRNMRERAEALPGGSFSVSSAPGAGTRIAADCRSEVEDHAGTTV